MKKIIAVIICLAVITGFSVLPAQAKMIIFDYHLPFEVWQGEGDKEGLAVTEERIKNNDGKDGAPIEQFFIFAAEKDGTYTVTFTLADADKTEIIETFTTTIVVD